VFTGIVEEMGRVVALTQPTDNDARLVIAAQKAADTTPGASIAVNGVCLTVLDEGAGATGGNLSFDVMPQTLKLTGLGSLQVGDAVNLERAMSASARFDGHLVQGHVDGRATLVSREPGPRWDALTFALAPALLAFVAPQGSITVDGVSLTITEVSDTGFSVALIPTTLAHTTLGALQVGEQVNTEVDAMAKYAAHLAKFAGGAGATEVQQVAEAELPTAHGTFRVYAFRDTNGVEHAALVNPQVIGDNPPLVRVHSECLTGDAFGSLRCDCGPQLAAAMQAVAANGGAILYMRGHEGRGIGFAAKIAAYALQDAGLDTVAANQELGLPVDARDYAAAIAMLNALDMPRIRLLTNNPAKREALTAGGIDVTELVPIEVGITPVNRFYLQTKRDVMGHHLTSLDA